MKITAKTKLKEMIFIAPLIDLADMDIVKECAKFERPEKIRGLKPVEFYDISFNNLAWLWDIKDSNEFILAIAEIFFFPKTNKWFQDFKDAEKWAKQWILNVPLIDFYNYCNYIKEQAEKAAQEFAAMKLNLSEEEKQAGYGATDPESIMKMIDSFAKRQHISSLEEAGNYSWSVYRFVFKVDIDEANRQRKYNEIITNKHK